jgi:sterol desaturase/sphingolipid hydroxylase (fatty acid hydroxylase superfamily)
VSPSAWQAASLGTIALAAVVLVGLERARPQTSQRALFRVGWLTDLAAYTLAQSWVLGLAIGALLAALDGATGASERGLVARWPFAAQLAFFVVTHDFAAYWIHRAQHRFPWLYRFHEAHHSGRDVDWLSGSRSHPVEILMNQSIEFAPIVLLGAPPEVAIAKATVDAVWGMWIHANVRAELGRVGLVVNGPELHRAHHAVFGARSNYATKLSLWDHLFRTARPPRDHAGPYGLGRDDYPTTYLGQVAHAFRRRRPPRARAA